MARILLVANKWFEADPLMSVLSNAEVRGPGIVLQEVVWPRERQKTVDEISPKPRCLIPLAKSVVEVWCIEDLMGPAPGVNHSNTSEKKKALDIIFAYGAAPGAVIAFGTGTYPSAASNNGNVSVGGTVFLHQPSGPANPSSTWAWPGHMEQLVPSSMPMQFLADFKSSTIPADIYSRWLAPRINAAPQEILSAKDAVAISSVNIISNADYARVDSEAINAARAAGAAEIGSVETTHGVIRAQSDAPFLFVTGIPNRFGHFGDEGLKNYPQNFVAAHNAGVVASYLLPLLPV